MKRSPFDDERPGLRRRIRLDSSHQDAIRGHDAEEGPQPVRNHQKSSSQKGEILRLSPGYHTEYAAQRSKWRLHRGATLVRRFPLQKQCLIIKGETRGLLGDVDLYRSTRENGCHNQCKMTYQHGCTPIRPMITYWPASRG